MNGVANRFSRGVMNSRPGSPADFQRGVSPASHLMRRRQHHIRHRFCHQGVIV